MHRFEDLFKREQLSWCVEEKSAEQFCTMVVEQRTISCIRMNWTNGQNWVLLKLEEFSLDGINYEAFNTSGGLGTLCETLEGKVKNLNYRTVRYPGHRDIMKMLLQDLKFRDNRDQLKTIFEDALPLTYQDVVLVFISVSGMKNGQLVQESYANKIYNETINGKLWSAIQVTTAAGICGVLDLMAEGKLPKQGFVRQEDVLFDDFINNRFGRYYQRLKDKQAAA